MSAVETPVAAVHVQRTHSGRFAYLVQTWQPRRADVLEVADTEDEAWDGARAVCARLDNRCPERR